MNTRMVLLGIWLCISLNVIGENAGAAVIFSEGKITGTVFDASTREAIEYASVAVFGRADSALIAGTVTRNDGRFTLTQIPEGNYYLEVQSMGYQRFNQPEIEVSRGKRGGQPLTIMLQKSVTQLDEVTVNMSLSPIEQRLDKKVVNVAQSHSASTESAVEVLADNGLIKINNEGEATLRNSTNFIVMIDGRQSPFNGTEALKQVSAIGIDKIEVITNPSAKYSAEGVAGIINIVSKKQKLNGTSAMVNASGSSNSSYGTDLLVNVKREKLSFYFGGDARSGVFDQHFDIQRNYSLNNQPFYNQQLVDQRAKRPSNNLKMGLDTELGQKNSLSLVATVGSNSFHKNKSINNVFAEGSQPRQYYAGKENYDVEGYFVKPVANWTHRFREKGNQLVMDVAYTYVNSDFSQIARDFPSNADFDELSDHYEGIKSGNRYHRNALDAKLDYNLKEDNGGALDAGVAYSGNRRDVRLLFETRDTQQMQWIPETSLSNQSLFTQDVYAGYVQYSAALAGFEYQLGLRSEYTRRLLRQQVSSEEFPYQRWHFFPGINVSYTFNEKTTAQLSYSRRITRPNDFWLNPYPSSLSKTLMSVGNPALKPDLTDSYELNVAYNRERWNLSGTAYYRYTAEAMTQLSRMDSDGKNILTFGNMASNTFSGVEVSSNIRQGNLNLSPTVELFYLESKGMIDDYVANSHDYSYVLRLAANYDIAGTWRFYVNAEYNGKAITQQGTIESFYVLSASLKRDFFKKQLSVVLQGRNLLGSGKILLDEYGTNFHNKIVYQTGTNVLSLSLGYRFNNFKRNSRIQGNVVNESF